MEIFETSTEQTTIVVSRRKKFLGFIKRSGRLIKYIFLYPFKKFRANTDNSDDENSINGTNNLKGKLTRGCLGKFNMRGMKRSAVRNNKNPNLMSSESTSNSSSIYNPNDIYGINTYTNNPKVENIVRDINKEIDANNRIIDKTIFNDCGIKNFEIGNTIGTGSYATVVIAKFNKNFDLNSDLLGYNGFKRNKEINLNNSYKSKSLIANIAENISNLLGTSKTTKTSTKIPNNTTLIGCQTITKVTETKNNYLEPYLKLESDLNLSSNINKDNDPYFKLISNLNSNSDLDIDRDLNIDLDLNTYPNLDLNLKLNLENGYNGSNSNDNNRNGKIEENNENKNEEYRVKDRENDIEDNDEEDYYFSSSSYGSSYDGLQDRFQDNLQDDIEFSKVLKITNSYEENNNNYYCSNNNSTKDNIKGYSNYYNSSIEDIKSIDREYYERVKGEKEKEKEKLRQLLIKKEEIELSKKREELLNLESKIVALKILNKVKLIRTKQLDHVKSEADILSRFSHPFIVDYYGRFQDSQNLYFILEFVGGGELFYYLRKVSRFSVDSARFYCSQVLLALDFLHSQGIVYRDLKPENILLDYIGYIRLVDFGFAKSLIKEDNKIISRTVTNSRINSINRISFISNNNGIDSNNNKYNKSIENNNRDNSNEDKMNTNNKDNNNNNNNTNSNNTINKINKDDQINNNDMTSSNSDNNRDNNNYNNIDHYNCSSINNVVINGLYHNYNSNISRCTSNRVMNKTYTICGTCEYLAPEVFLKKGHGLQADFYSFGVLLYELLVGIPPFYSQDPQLTYSLALKHGIDFPRYMDKPTKDIIKKLLKVDPNKRLGNNIKDVYKHPFFSHINFDDVLFKRQKAPIMPILKSKEDISNFAKYPEIWKNNKDQPTEEDQSLFDFF